MTWRTRATSRHELSMGRENVIEAGKAVLPVLRDLTELLVLEFRELAQPALHPCSETY